ncbi:hypothetical protein [Rubellimicrobium aerolatum]|uniref:Uncharacterized protein n=1 Tax=Rubellimicrobium aerolatum TaxID=490979 RepID=A0ABW0SFC8_9RHOB|nr:hypothetical protein [Rubellimicrobium aerolatum]MBP1806490.1 hypothetical protein [Rubellimicrobium aerolatum]
MTPHPLHPRDEADARATLTDPRAHRGQPLLIAPAWAYLKQRQGQPISARQWTRLHPVHRVAPDPFPALPAVTPAEEPTLAQALDRARPAITRACAEALSRRRAACAGDAA